MKHVTDQGKHNRRNPLPYISCVKCGAGDKPEKRPGRATLLLPCSIQKPAGGCRRAYATDR